MKHWSYLAPAGAICVLGSFFFTWFKVAGTRVSGVSEGGSLWTFVVLAALILWAFSIQKQWPLLAKATIVGSGVAGLVMMGTVIHRVYHTKVAFISVTKVFDVHWQPAFFLLGLGFIATLIGGVMMEPTSPTATASEKADA